MANRMPELGPNELETTHPIPFVRVPCSLSLLN